MIKTTRAGINSERLNILLKAQQIILTEIASANEKETLDALLRVSQKLNNLRNEPMTIHAHNE